MYLYSPVVINLEYVKKEFNKIKLKLSNCTGGEKYFDPIRKIFVAIMPEETVRQKMIRYMQKYMSVPSTNIGIEEHLSHFGIKQYNGRIDMVITNVTHVDKDDEKNIKEHALVKGAIFNFRNDLLPVEFKVENEQGIKYFDDLGASGSEPVYTRVWGKIISETKTTTQEVESAFGEAAVRTYRNTNKEWIITGTAKVPYEFGDENILTAEELTKAAQNREVYLADVKKRADEYKASRAAGTTAPATTATKTAEFNF